MADNDLALGGIVEAGLQIAVLARYRNFRALRMIRKVAGPCGLASFAVFW